jgi:MFS family permease
MAGRAAFPLGITADWFGRRKPFILLGLVFSAVGAYIMSTTTSIDGMIVGRAITGLAAASWVPLVVVYSGLFSPGEAVRAAAILTLVNSISRMFATALNGTRSTAWAATHWPLPSQSLRLDWQYLSCCRCENPPGCNSPFSHRYSAVGYPARCAAAIPAQRTWHSMLPGPQCLALCPSWLINTAPLMCCWDPGQHEYWRWRIGKCDHDRCD